MPIASSWQAATPRPCGCAIERLLANPSGLLVTILLMNTAVNTSAFVLATVAGAGRFNAGVQGAIGIATLLLTILAGEVTPKTLAVANRSAPLL